MYTRHRTKYITYSTAFFLYTYMNVFPHI